MFYACSGSRSPSPCASVASAGDLRTHLVQGRPSHRAGRKPANPRLASEGYDPQFGARPVRRTLERHVENPLSKRLLASEFSEGDTVVVDVAENSEGKPEPVFNKRSPDPIPVELPVQRMANSR